MADKKKTEERTALDIDIDLLADRCRKEGKPIMLVVESGNGMVHSVAYGDPQKLAGLLHTFMANNRLALAAVKLADFAFSMETKQTESEKNGKN